MYCTFPRLVSHGIFAALLLLLLPGRSLAQHQQGCGGGNTGGPCYVFADSDHVNKFTRCAVRTGSTQDVDHLDGNHETIQETGIPPLGGCNSGCGEWVWVFDNVPSGPRYLRVQGYSDAFNYNLIYRYCNTGQNCPTDVYTSAVSITPGTQNTLQTFQLPDGTSPGKVCVILQATGQPTSCSDIDFVYIDLLVITKGPGCLP